MEKVAQTCRVGAWLWSCCVVSLFSFYLTTRCPSAHVETSSVLFSTKPIYGITWFCSKRFDWAAVSVQEFTHDVNLHVTQTAPIFTTRLGLREKGHIPRSSLHPAYLCAKTKIDTVFEDRRLLQLTRGAWPPFTCFCNCRSARGWCQVGSARDSVHATPAPWPPYLGQFTVRLAALSLLFIFLLSLTSLSAFDVLFWCLQILFHAWKKKFGRHIEIWVWRTINIFEIA